MINILFAAKAASWRDYETPLRRALDSKGLDYRLSCEVSDPASVDYLIYAPHGPVDDFTPFTRAKAVLSLWAGVESIVTNPSLTQPLTRMVDHGLSQGMTEWVCGHVLRYHLGMDAQILHQDGRWVQTVPPLAQNRNVTVLGLGALGQAAAQALCGLGFQVTGWSRRPKQIEGITCLSGAEGLQQALRRAEILVLLLPLTPDTENLLGAEQFAQMPKGAKLLNPGRGALIDDPALLAALDSGQIGHATLDVFRTEPLPAEHPFWQHPNVTVTPHIASETRPETAAQVIAENIDRAETGQELLYQVNRAAGY